MSRLERNDIDDEVEAVRDGERSLLVAIECDVLETIRRRPLALACEGQRPPVSEK